ncbi:MAG: hypothetical protein K8S98_18275 [Planctomycetes bacterium]|nr:hypothetical protein [Planctomycetota bacterium]
MRLFVHFRSTHARRGSALVMIMVLMTALAGLSAAMIAMTNTTHVENREAKRQIAAQAVAEAGIHLAYRSLAAGGAGTIGSANAPANWDGATYYVTQTNGANSTVTLTSTADVERAESSVSLCLRLVTTPLFRWGAFGEDNLHMGSNAFVDSYDARNGSYAGQATNGSGATQHAASNGDLGSNANILLEQNATAYGKATPGATNTTTVLGSAQLSGTSTPATAPADLPPINLPSIATGGPLNVAANATITLGPGAVRYSSLLANAGATINVVGPLTLICDSFDLQADTTFLVDATLGDVQLYVINDFLLSTHATLHATDFSTSHLQINLLSDNIIDPDIDVELDPDDLTLGADTKIYGMLYAPHSSVVIDSNFELYGSLVARDVDLGNNGRVHFDEALLSDGPMGTPQYQRIAWQVTD